MRISVEFDGKRAKRVIRGGAILGLLLGLGVPVCLFAGQVGSLVTFSPGQTIKSADFNQNFTSIQTAVNDNDRRIGNLTSLQTSAKTDLVAALNEVFQKPTVGPQGIQGIQGIQGVQGIQGPPGAGPNKLVASLLTNFNTTAGNNNISFRVTTQDSAGTVIPTNGTQVFVLVGNGPSSAINGTTVVTTAGGTGNADFTALGFDTKGTYTLVVAANGFLPTVLTTNCTIGHGAVASARFTRPPACGAINTPFQVVVTLLDAKGNVCDTANGVPTITLTNRFAPAGAVLLNGGATSPSSGAVTFNGVQENTAGSYTLLATVSPGGFTVESPLFQCN